VTLNETPRNSYSYFLLEFLLIIPVQINYELSLRLSVEKLCTSECKAFRSHLFPNDAKYVSLRQRRGLLGGEVHQPFPCTTTTNGGHFKPTPS